MMVLTVILPIGIAEKKSVLSKIFRKEHFETTGTSAIKAFLMHIGQDNNQ